MTLKNVKLAINQFESINTLEKYVYEKAILAYQTIKKLTIFLYETLQYIESVGEDLKKRNDF